MKTDLCVDSCCVRVFYFGFDAAAVFEAPVDFVAAESESPEVF